ncbi:MAG: hypothetical protein KKB90_13340 [Actinobacteria bacterium]|nr:hypothetical protein [Actinomycetota bacterium]
MRNGECDINASILAAVIAGLFLLAGASLGLLLPIILKRPPTRRERNVSLVILVALAIATGILFLVGFLLRTPPSVKITYPGNGSEVAMREAVRGVSQNIGTKGSLSVVVYIPADRRHYPQVQEPNVLPNGNWEAEAWFGGTGDSGLRFEVEAVLVDAEARGALENYFSDCEKANSWPGMDELPEGAEIYDRVNVVRE